MSTKHTPGPWRVLPEEAKPYIRIRGTRLGGKFKIANVLIAGDFDAQEACSNARRIVAAVNACEGIDTDELERIAATGGMLGPRDDVARIAGQRDELLAALKSMVQMIDYAVQAKMNGSISNNCPTTDAARAAIKSATGE